jgi:multidrug efflux pump subunit AcrA (membrane-fusion protein)
LVSPVAGLVTKRLAEPGTTVVAGEPVVEVVDPQSIWINARFDQLRASGLEVDLPTSLVLRSRPSESLQGKVGRVEPVADAVTEELLAKIVFESVPDPLPAIGELAEATVELPGLVWVVEGSKVDFVTVELGASDLDGFVQIRKGLRPGQRVVSHSRSTLSAGSSIEVVDRIPGAPQ